MERNLAQEKVYVDKFFQSQGKAPSTPEDWKSIHTATYGAQLPAELAQLPMYQQVSSNPVSNVSMTTTSSDTPIGGGLNYMGADISDTALTQARDNALSYNQTGFLDKVKARLQQKFKPEVETLGMGSFSSTLGPLDPSGVMTGVNEKSNQFRRKGTLALQALSTANDIYSEEAKRAMEKLTRLENYRSQYETEQKQLESEMKSLALTIAQSGKEIPNEILSMLPQNLQAAYQALPQIFANTGVGQEWYGGGSASNGWSGDELILEKGSGDAYECGYWARGLTNIDVPMGNSFKEKSDWINKLGTRGSAGLSVGDLVVTDGSDVSKDGRPLATGHALIVGAMDKDGNIYAYEANAKGDKTVTFGRWVDPSAIYGYVGGNSQFGNPDYGVMKPEEFARLQAYTSKINPAGKGKPATTAKENSVFDNLIKLNLTPAEERARLQSYVGEDKDGKKLAQVLQQYDAYKIQRGTGLENTAINNAITSAIIGLKFNSVADKQAAQADIEKMITAGDYDGAREQLKIYARNSASATQQEKLEGKEDALAALDKIESAMNAYSAAGGNMNVFTGISDKLLEKGGIAIDPKRSELANSVALAIIDYRKSISGAAFTASEAADYARVFPSTGKTTELNQIKINSLRDKLKTDAENFYRRRIGETKYDEIFGDVNKKYKSPLQYPTLEEFTRNNPGFEDDIKIIATELIKNGASDNWQNVSELLEDAINNGSAISNVSFDTQQKGKELSLGKFALKSVAGPFSPFINPYK